MEAHFYFRFFSHNLSGVVLSPTSTFIWPLQIPFRGHMKLHFHTHSTSHDHFEQWYELHIRVK